MAPGSAVVACPNAALNSVALSAGDLLWTVCQWSTPRLVEDALLVGVEGM